MGQGRNAFFALLVFWVVAYGVGCKPQWIAVQSDGAFLVVKDLKNDATCDEILKPFSDSVSKSMGLVLCQSSVALPKIKGVHETALGNLMSDILLNRAKLSNPQVQASLLNLGGIRASLPHGSITLGDVFSLMPFDNRIAIMHLGPSEKKEMFRYIGEHVGTPFSGFELRCEGNNWIGLFNGVPIPDSDSLLVATSDFLAQGGDKMNFFLTSTMLSDPGLLLRDGIIAYMNEHQHSGKAIYPKLDNRILPCNEK